MNVEIVDMGDIEIGLMATKMRPMDRFEFDVMSNGKTLIGALEYLQRRSHTAKAAYVDGELAAVWGIVPITILSDEGHPWMAATDLINIRAVQKEFIRATRRELAHAANGFSKLWNLVYAENTMAIRFIKWIGFEFDEVIIPVSGHNFLKFRMEG